MEDRGAASTDGRSAGIAGSTLLTRVQQGLAPAGSPGTGTRRCPCCGREIRAGQQITTIHGTSVHVRCASNNQR